MDSLDREIRGRALTQFQKLNLTDKSKLSKQELFHALDFICTKNSGIRLFSPKIKSKLWHQCHKTSHDWIILDNFLDTVSKQMIGTLSLIEKTEEILKLDSVCLQEKIQLRKKMIQYKSQHKYLSLTFKFSHGVQITKENLSVLSDSNPEERQKPDIQIQEQFDAMESLRHEQGDLFLQIFLRSKGVSQSSIQRLQASRIVSLSKLKEMSIEDLCITGIKIADSILIKKI